MKKCITVLLSVALLCSLCGCASEPPNEDKYSVEVWIVKESTEEWVRFECQTYYPGSTKIINEIDGIDFSDVKQISIAPIDEFAFNIVRCCSERYYGIDSSGWGGTKCQFHTADEGPDRTIELHITDAEGYSKDHINLTLRFLG